MKFLFLILFLLFCSFLFNVILSFSITKAILSIFLLLIVNLIGSHFQMMIPLNLFTFGVAMFLRIPGIIMLVIFYTFFFVSVTAG
ncbi:pro-sigmaK processing inhibitor BofA family protein [Massilibacterium senegalense]|uniref:pro-sigmaK processing inhibitor BofA family protein n=1 Tax=Massilibacterium senegalense TaxID=1632858 RepID=UPI0007821FC8|nr:pro-sigmaK processing inhibitor BofA family protein [Massilibacterium senegalense]